jgi:hypothetical protein
MSDRQKQAKAKKQNQNYLEGLLEAREGRVSRLDQIEVSRVRHLFLFFLMYIMRN